MRILIAGLLFCLSSAAWGATIYDNGVPVTNPTSDCSSACPDIATSVGSGMFTLVSSVTITSVEFWTLESLSSYHGGELTWQICLDGSCSPGSILGTGNFTLSQTTLGFVDVAGYGTTEYQNDFTVPSLTLNLSSPQSFYLNISDHSGQDTFGIFWATSDVDTLAFQIDGTINQVPEPATFVLLGAGLAGLLGLKRRAERR